MNCGYTNCNLNKCNECTKQAIFLTPMNYNENSDEVKNNCRCLSYDIAQFSSIEDKKKYEDEAIIFATKRNFPIPIFPGRKG